MTITCNKFIDIRAPTLSKDVSFKSRQSPRNHSYTDIENDPILKPSGFSNKSISSRDVPTIKHLPSSHYEEPPKKELIDNGGSEKITIKGKIYYKNPLYRL